MAPALRKLDSNGILYKRRSDVEATLNDILLLPRSGIAARCGVMDVAHADHVPSECLLHLVRASHSDNSEVYFATLYRALRQRVLARLPRVEVGKGPDGQILISQTNAKIAEDV